METTLTLKSVKLGSSLAAKESIMGRGMSSITDQAVVERVLSGDLDAYQILVDRYQDRVYSVVHNYVANPDDAIDITQETFIKAYNNLHSFNSSSAFYTWLYRIAINTAIDYLRKRRSRPVESLDDEKYTEVGFEPVSDDSDTDPEKMAVRREIRTALRNGISRLSHKLRGALVLHDIEGFSQEEVAEILGIPVGTVKSRVSRARLELRNMLRKQIGELV